MSNEIVVHIDGSCLGNPGRGGWAVILHYEDDKDQLHEMELTGNEAHTTNNRMEIEALTQALRAIKSNSRKNLTIKVYTDSQIIVDLFPELDSMILSEFRKPSGGWYKNSDKWLEVSYEVLRLKPRTIEVYKVAGHSHNLLNERCDKLAKKKAREVKT